MNRNYKILPLFVYNVALLRNSNPKYSGFYTQIAFLLVAPYTSSIRLTVEAVVSTTSLGYSLNNKNDTATTEHSKPLFLVFLSLRRFGPQNKE